MSIWWKVAVIAGILLVCVEGYFLYNFYVPDPAVIAATAAPADDDALDPEGEEAAVPTLEEDIKECTGAEDLCVRRIVRQLAPEAEYVGGRLDTDISGTEQSRRVLYFEDDNAEVCEYTKLEHISADASTIYVAIVAGKDTFKTDVEDCLPEP